MAGYDIAVVGGGPGGYVAAIRAAQLGMRAVVIEREHLGGICLNWGCIPTKALLRTAEIFETMRHAERYGLVCDHPRVDLSAIVKRSRDVAGQLSGGIGHLLRKNKVDVVNGAAKLAGPNRLAVTEPGGKVVEVATQRIIFATGARARVVPGIVPDGRRIWTYREAMVPEKLPKKLLVIGSGAIGIEFASFYHSIGSEIVVVELLDRILPVEDAEISALAQKSLQAQGMEILTGASVRSIKVDGEGIVAEIEQGGKVLPVSAECAISAVGVVGNVEEIGLAGTNIAVDRGHIVTDEWSWAGEAGIYAIGDVAGPPWLAHKASHEGMICVEKIAGLDVHPLNVSRIPGCTYCRPQVASIGLTEEQARGDGREIRVGRFPFIGNGKAIALGEPEGLIKTIFDTGSGELLGAHMIGAEVTELIQGYAIAMTLETTEAELMHTVFPHPTLSEMMHESVLAAYGRAVHF